MEKILIYSNCHGGRLHQMFDTHPLTKNRFSVSYISNYEELRNETLSPLHSQLIRECDFFIYQPFNKTYENTEYDINSIKRHLKPSCIVFRIILLPFQRVLVRVQCETICCTRILQVPGWTSRHRSPQ